MNKILQWRLLLFGIICFQVVYVGLFPGNFKLILFFFVFILLLKNMNKSKTVFAKEKIIFNSNFVLRKVNLFCRRKCALLLNHYGQEITPQSCWLGLVVLLMKIVCLKSVLCLQLDQLLPCTATEKVYLFYMSTVLMSNSFQT